MKFAVWVSAALTGLSLTAPSWAVPLTTLYANLGGPSWQVDLVLANDNATLVGAANPAGTISEFTVFFPYASFTRLMSRSAPAA